MGAFSQHVAAASRRAPRVVKIGPNAFADTWEAKPGGPVEIGLRLVAEADLAAARSVASRKATELHPGLDARSDVWIESYNQALMHWAIACGTCLPEDVEQPFWDMAEDVVPLALSEGGALRLFGELEILTMTESVVTPEIDAEGLSRLAEALQTGTAWAGKSALQKRRLGRLLTSVLQMIELAEG